MLARFELRSFREVVKHHSHTLQEEPKILYFLLEIVYIKSSEFLLSFQRVN